MCGGALEGSHGLSMQKVLQELQARGHPPVVLVLQPNQDVSERPLSLREPMPLLSRRMSLITSPAAPSEDL